MYHSVKMFRGGERALFVALSKRLEGERALFVALSKRLEGERALFVALYQNIV